MRKLSLILILLLSAFSGKTQEIRQPAIEFSNSGIYSIERIVRSDTATLLDVRIDFVPGWWTMFSRKNFLEDEQTGKKYQASGIRGAGFDQKLKTPVSGDTSVTLIFPKLDKKVTKVNFGQDKETYVFGVSLHKGAKAKIENKVPASIQQWINEEVNAARVKVLNDKSGLFRMDSIKIVGYIKGFDRRAGFSSGIIYHSNKLTNEDYPTTIRVFDDGRFETAFLAKHPVQSVLLIKKKWIPFYAEPGNTLGIVLDWQEFLYADRYRNISYDFKDIQYLGATKTINEELLAIPVNQPDYRNLEKLRKTQSPDDFKAKQLAAWDKERERLDSLLQAKPVSGKAERLIRNELSLERANYLFDYELSRDYYSKQDTSNKILKMPISDNYYDFIKRIDLDDQTLVVSKEFSTFINRYEFSPLFPRNIQYYKEADSASLAQNKSYSFVYNIAKIRDVATDFERFSLHDKENAQKRLASATANIDHPFLIAEARRVFDKVFNRDSTGYELPETAGGNIFKGIIGPHKGKVLIVDFWAQWCGPCVAGIQRSLSTRQKLKDKKEIAFLFITDKESTAQDFYDKFVEENQMIHTYRISADDYLALRELFKFNGIPRYVLVDEEGRIRDEDFQMYSLVTSLSRFFPKKFNHSYFD